jgi:thiol:disulfide interchange protein
VFQAGSFVEAQARAQEKGSWLIVDATAEWCGPCKQMDKVTWRDGDVVRWIEANGVAVQLDPARYWRAYV